MEHTPSNSAREGVAVFKKLVGFVAILFVVLAVGWLAMKRDNIPYTTLESAYANNASEFMTLEDGLKVHYRDEGLIDGPTLILVHGFSASLHTWEAWVKDLKKDHRVISLDLPAHGLTRAPENYPVGIEQFVKVVDEVSDYLQAGKFTLVGSSMGGNTAWEFALAHPEKLEGLVLVGASGWPESEEDAENEPFVFKLLANPTARWLMKDLDMTSLIRGGLRDSFVDQNFVTDEMVARYASLSRAPGHRAAILRMISDPNGRRMASETLMAKIYPPTLVLHGDQDNLVPVEGGQKFAAFIPEAEIIVYESVGHLPQEEVADRSLSDLRAFLTDRVRFAVEFEEDDDASKAAELNSAPH